MIYDWGVPILLTAATIALFMVLRVPLELAGHPAATAALSNLLALLIAFYMAALAAVATFGRTDIDQPLRGGDAILLVLNHTTWKREPKALSYRQFICFLFGYLSFLSLILFLALLAFSLLWPRIEGLASGHPIWALIALWGENAVFVTFVFGFWQLFIGSLLGIYFLTDRIHTINDPQH